MKISLLLICMFATVWVKAQEFGEYKNGLIYRDTTMGQLKHIVDSLNLKFKVCERNSTYYPLEQGRGNYFSLSGEQAAEAWNDIKQSMPFDLLVRKYPAARIEKGVVVIKAPRQDREADEPAFDVFSLTLNGEDWYPDMDLEEDQPLQKGKWLSGFKPYKEKRYENVSGFYMTEVFHPAAIPHSYADMIQYADCLVDTSQQLFSHGKPHPGPKADSLTRVTDFLRYADKLVSRQEEVRDSLETVYKEDKDIPVFWNAFDTYRQTQIGRYAQSDTFKQMLQAAIAEALANNEAYNDSYSSERSLSNDEFETLVARFDKPAVALELKRGREVWGMCSMDSRPREHARAIAELAAVSVEWEIFLRAHLDIMNDNFKRGTDGSYAQEGRKTYLRELEMLDINVPDLLMGTVFRYKNTATHHYSGNTGRIGRALSETQQPDLIESKMLQAISNRKLDLYNRAMVYYVFLNYNFFLKDKIRQERNSKKLKAALASFPVYLRKDAITAFKEEPE